MSAPAPVATEPAPTPAKSEQPSQPAPADSTPAAPVPAVDPGTYAGSVNGGAASVAIAVKDGKAIAYVCDGKQVEAWLQGPVAGTSLTLSGNKSASLTAQYSEGWLSGSIAAAGKKWTFRVKAVKPPSGLYRAAQKVNTATVVGGWIVTPDGKQVGMLDRGDDVETPAPAVDVATGTVTIGGTVVRATPLG